MGDMSSGGVKGRPNSGVVKPSPREGSGILKVGITLLLPWRNPETVRPGVDGRVRVRAHDEVSFGIIEVLL